MTTSLPTYALILDLYALARVGSRFPERTARAGELFVRGADGRRFADPIVFQRVHYPGHHLRTQPFSGSTIPH